ncbi:hypothetical protein F4553_001977 [Allocatelliglobosispora scoriae]|uniref:Tetratricopeptide repeat protein n=1 Tax=Allocatelliglobosispora scoriae TaxID=643052 RepID=A0A841BMJ6_9ACTN|nr:hypothetical protein [Allocatelliglobosispora scoriae]
MSRRQRVADLLPAVLDMADWELAEALYREAIQGTERLA